MDPESDQMQDIQNALEPAPVPAKAKPSKTRMVLPYVIVLIFAIVLYFYAQEVQASSPYNEPQPVVSLTYNYISQEGSGFILNNLTYPINITFIYCTTPNGEHYTFRDVLHNATTVGENTMISIADNNSQNESLPTDCAHWAVLYNNSQK